MSILTDTIAAISSGHLSASAIAVIRMSGDQAAAVLHKIMIPDKPLVSRQLRHGFIVDPITGQKIDEVMAVYLAAPHTYTGQDMVEIYGHGGLTVSEQVLTVCLSQGVRLAGHGEFTRRAFLNGKMDLPQAEGVADIIEADSLSTIKLAMQGLTGQVSELLDQLRQQLMEVMAHIEVNIDYPEYDDDTGTITAGQIVPLIEQWLKQCDHIIDVSASGQLIKQGIKTVIVGKPNVGKSSLLNALLQQDKAIVTPIAGTTRDLVEGEIHLNDLKLHLIDTAGLHDSSDPIEKLGIEKSRQAIQQAQLVIVVLDGSAPLDEQDEQLLVATKNTNRIVVYNKQDLAAKPQALGISAKNGEIQPLIDEITNRFKQHQVALQQPVLSNQRQIGLLKQARIEMDQALQILRLGDSPDLAADSLQAAYQRLGEIKGLNSDDDLMSAVFDRFCVGK